MGLVKKSRDSSGNSCKTSRFKAFLTYQLAVRVLTTSQLAMRAALHGYSHEALALSRTLSEIARVNIYLCFNEREIPNYVSGKLRVKEILKREKRLNREGKQENHQSKLWAYLSDFTHATPEFFTSLTRREGDTHKVDVLITNPQGVSDVCGGISSLFFYYYNWFRMVFKGVLDIPEEVVEAEKLYFGDLPKLVFTSVHEQLPVMHTMLYE